jgi:lipopolysaccharide transport system permease protein
MAALACGGNFARSRLTVAARRRQQRERTMPASNSVMQERSNARKTLRAMLKGVQEEWRPAARLANRTFALRFRNSRFGLFWEFADPLVLAAIFILLNEYRGISVRADGTPYPLFVITGLMMWQSFTDGLTTCDRAFSSQKSLLSALKLAPELIVLSNLYTVMFSTSLRLLIAAAVIIFFCGLNSGLLAFLGISLCLMLLGCGLGFILAPFSTIIGDVRFFVRIVTRLGMFLSSVIFPLPKGTLLFDILRTLNPAAVLIENARSFAVSGVALDSPLFLATYLLTSIGIFLVGWYVVHVTLPIVGDQ